jgi:hypothetical protein
MASCTSSCTLSEWLALAPACGLPASRFVPSSLWPQIQQISENSIPSGAPSDFSTVCQANLIARGIIYYKNNAGDCGTPATLNFSNSQLAGASGSIAVGIASMAGATLPGIGVAVAAIQAIFAGHAQAVATEQATICQVAGIINQVFAYYDSLVAEGEIDPSDAYTGMQTFLNQANEELQTIEKTCNAACVYQGILKAHAQFCTVYYPALAPVSLAPHAPAAPPASLGTTPGGIVQVGGAGVATTLAPATNVQPNPLTQPQELGEGIGASSGVGLQVSAATPLVQAGPVSISVDTLVLVGLLAVAAIVIGALVL